ncbi:hypothetical protein [Glaciimonas immobilis]|uniref:Uncharacterized protein n=1 Tax=Glaciimonas immobilis TaxID=728004 RepID=A0A840RQT2_9BURK|nr:hypothetical protein [Glaciimonas immobilis]KAF3997529.1 hypothetical protein HAV38_12685 [Glaciimonas immobilis]MBB5200787.1 hypothetical protein [Glaciimonas immobilis]
MSDKGASVDIHQERAKFEAWAKSINYGNHLERFFVGGGDYIQYQVAKWWQSWQERAVQSARAIEAEHGIIGKEAEG